MKAIWIVAFVALATPAQAELKAQSGSESWCSGYSKEFQGVWFFPDGSEALIFRAGVSGSEGCYAALHGVPAWGFEEGGEFKMPAREFDGGWNLGAPGHHIQIQLYSNNHAEYLLNGHATTGRLK